MKGQTMVEAAEGAGAPGAGRTPPEPGPLSFAQERVWLLDQIASDRSAYHLCAVERIEGALDLETLRRSFAEVSTTLEAVDLAGASDAEREARKLAAESARRPFDLVAAAPVRATLYRISATVHVLCLVVHAIVCDSNSLRALFREIAALYDAFVAGRPVLFEGPAVRYADFSARQRRQLTEHPPDSQLVT
jgi:hypothetical protein